MLFRGHCYHQMLPFEMPTKLSRNGFIEISSNPMGFINTKIHENSFAKNTAKTLSIFGTSHGISEEDVNKWQSQLE